jgi:hypothetical protein
LTNILRQGLARPWLDPVHVGDVFYFGDSLIQPAAIQTVLIEIPANIREVALGGFIVAAIALGPRLMMLDAAQILLRLPDDAMGPIPILRGNQRWDRET